MAIGNHYILIDLQVVDSMEMLNVYAYEQTTGSGDSSALAAAYVDSILPSMKAFQSSGLEHIKVQVTNKEVPSDFTELATAVSGEISGERLPPFCAFSVQLSRASRASRNGHKRVGGVPEVSQQQGTLSSGALAQLQTYADAIAAPLVDSDGNSWTPKIWRRLSATHAEDFFPINAGIASNNVTSQNTRKFGRGI